MANNNTDNENMGNLGENQGNLNQNQNRDEQGGGRGFAGMTPEERARVSSEGGKAAHRKGTAHEFDSDTGKAAGSRGGRAGGGNNTNIDNENER